MTKLAAFKKPFLDFQFAIGDLARATGVSTRQLRYWEQQGYVEASARPDNQKTRLYDFSALLKVALIRDFMAEQQLSLQQAVAKAEQHMDSARLIRRMLLDSLDGLQHHDGKTMIDLGPLDSDADQHVHAYCDDDNVTKYCLRSPKNRVD